MATKQPTRAPHQMGAVDFADRRLAGKSGKMSAYTPPDKIEKSSALALVQALIGAQRAINSMKVEAETAAQGDEQMMLDACEQISNEGFEADVAIRAALASAAQPPADGALNTIAAMFHSAEEIEGPDGLAMMVDMALWNEALEAFDEISGDEMEPAQPPAGWRRVPAPPDFAGAYQGAREDLAIWKRRALEAESALRTEQEASSRLAAEVNEANGPTHLGEPVQPERVPLTGLRMDEVVRLAHIEWCLDKYTSYEVALIRLTEIAHGIKPTKE